MGIKQSVVSWPILIAAGFIVLAVILFAGLWPFSFLESNQAEWDAAQKGLAFGRHGIAHSAGPLENAPERPTTNRPLYLSLRFTPAGSIHRHVGRILSLYDSVTRQERLVIGQWRGQLIIQCPAGSPATGSACPGRTADNQLVPEKPYQLRLDFDEKELALTQGADLKHVFECVPGIDATGLERCVVILGNGPEGTDPWQGSIQELSIARSANGALGATSPALTEVVHWTFDEQISSTAPDRSGHGNTLLIPTRFTPLRRVILESPLKDFRASRSYLSDIVVNIVGFFPFGLIAFLILVRANRRMAFSRAILLTIALGACLSLSIELAQAFLPDRHSQVADVLNNTLGAALGSRVGLLLRKS